MQKTETYKKILQTFSDAELIDIEIKKMNDFQKILDKKLKNQNIVYERKEPTEYKKISVEGTSGTGSIKVTLNGDGEMIKIYISPEILKEDKSIIEDLITAAHNNAKKLKGQNI